MRLRSIVLTIAAAAMALVPVSSQALPACGSWAIVSSPNVDPISTDNFFNDVTAISPSNAWAVGAHSDALSPAPELSLAEHWNGTAWKVVSTPNATDTVSGISQNRGNRLNAVTAISGSNIWAVGAHATLPGDGIGSFTLVEHWNGTAWKVISSPNVGPAENKLNAIVAKSPSDIWAVGSSLDNFSNTAESPLVMHWNGTSWQVIPTPKYGTYSRLFGVAKVPGTSKLWAVGEYEKVDSVTGIRTGGALIEKFNGTDWTVAAHIPGGSLSDWKSLNSVTAISDSNAFAVGARVMHWNGTSWNVMPDALPSNSGYPAELEAVTRAPNGNLWAAGWRADPQTGSYHTLIERWDGTSWSVVPSVDRGRSFLYGIAKAPASTRVWSVGYSSDSSPNRTLIETYC